MAKKKGIYYPRTTAHQRALLFETWEKTDDIETACRVANVSRRTFYIWKPRFEANGYAGLTEYASRAPKAPFRTPAEIEAQVINLKKENPSWGKERLARELTEDRDTTSTVSANTVRRILQDVGLWRSEKR